MSDDPGKTLGDDANEAHSKAGSPFRWCRRYGVAWLLTVLFIYSLGVWNGWQRPGKWWVSSPIRIAFGQGELIVQTTDRPSYGRGIGSWPDLLDERYTKQPDAPYLPVKGWWPCNTWTRWQPQRFGMISISPSFYQDYVRIPIVWLPILAWGWIAFRSRPRRQRKRLEGQCPHCRYDIRGLPSNRCPECGGRTDE